jgi:hypothetical protein
MTCCRVVDHVVKIGDVTQALKPILEGGSDIIESYKLHRMIQLAIFRALILSSSSRPNFDIIQTTIYHVGPTSAPPSRKGNLQWFAKV